MAERLVATGRDTLVQALMSPPAFEVGGDAEGYPGTLADHLIDTGAVRIVDPAEPQLRWRVAKRLREIEVQAGAGIRLEDTQWAADQLIAAAFGD